MNQYCTSVHFTHLILQTAVEHKMRAAKSGKTIAQTDRGIGFVWYQRFFGRII